MERQPSALFPIFGVRAYHSFLSKSPDDQLTDFSRAVEADFRTIGTLSSSKSSESIKLLFALVGLEELNNQTYSCS